MDIAKCYGKVVLAKNGEEYGVIRAATRPYPDALRNVDVLAEDECGNYFFEFDSQVYFWDHETNENLLVSESVSLFANSCFERAEVVEENSEVISAWIDPEFVKQHRGKQ